MNRTAEIKRKTKETDIELKLNLDGKGEGEIVTGVGFFDHMLNLVKVHANLDLFVKCNGDVHVDFHHTVEDIGIVLGDAINKALGDKKGIERYASRILPMDDAVSEVAIDLGGRSGLIFKPTLKGKVGDFDAELAEEFFRALCSNMKANIYIALKEQGNMHHNIEAIFKGFARCFKDAIRITGEKIPSSKGSL